SASRRAWRLSTGCCGAGWVMEDALGNGRHPHRQPLGWLPAGVAEGAIAVGADVDCVSLADAQRLLLPVVDLDVAPEHEEEEFAASGIGRLLDASAGCEVDEDGEHLLP